MHTYRDFQLTGKTYGDFERDGVRFLEWLAHS
jgi:hypothetical protein